MKFKKVVLSGVCAVALVVGTVAGTMAYLTAETDTVENTFTVGELFDEGSLTLWEHKAIDANNDGVYELGTDEVTGNEYKVLPGVDIPKDPTVDVVGLKDNAYLFLKVEGTSHENFVWSVDTNNWTQLDAVKYPGIWVYSGKLAANNIVSGTEAGVDFTVNVMTNQVITVDDDFESGNQGTIKFTAYMVQAAGFNNAAAAWADSGFAA